MADLRTQTSAILHKAIAKINPRIITSNMESDNISTALDTIYIPFSDMHEIRLLHLEPGSLTEPLVGHLENVNIQESPQFEAMSYAWGDKTSTAQIMVRSAAVTIPKNLHDAIWRVRQTSETRILWTDAVCIDQSNRRERSHQVSIMGKIFKKAERVLVWLGDDEDGKSGEVIDFLHDLELRIDDNAKPVESGLLGLKFEPRDLTSHEEIQFKGLARLFNQPWFRRVWTLQEIGFATDASVFYGNAETSFMSLMKVLGWLESEGQLLISHFGIQLNPRYRFCVLFYKDFDPTLMMSFGCRNRLQIADFLAVLKYAREYGASDPRDRIYAFTGLLGLSSALIGDENNIGVDYEKSAADVFAHFAENYVKQPSGLRILSHVDVEERTLEDNHVASWVPIWDKPKLTLELGSKLHWYHAGGFSDSPLVWVDNNILILRGCVFDVVSWANETFSSSTFDFTPHSLASHELEALWNSMLRESSVPKIPYEDPHIAFSLTLAGGLTGLLPAEEDLKLHFANFCAYLEKLYIARSTGRCDPRLEQSQTFELSEAAKGGNWAQYMVDSQRVCSNRKFFVNKTGYIGVGPATLSAGDTCCVLLGATVPFILRKAGSCYKLVGECYIHGIMRGEALKLCQSNQWTEETVYIC